MARTSKIALITATALAILAVLTGSLLASAESRAATPGQSSSAAVLVADSSAEQSDGDVADSGVMRGRGNWQGAEGPQDLGRMTVDRDGGWNASDILQWVAIGLLGGFAVALMIWRPWRPGGSPAAVPAAAAPVTYYATAAPYAPAATSPEATAPAHPAVMTPAVDTAPPTVEQTAPADAASHTAEETVAPDAATEITQAQPAAGETPAGMADADDASKPPAPPSPAG
jgi:hypothetical protein